MEAAKCNDASTELAQADVHSASIEYAKRFSGKIGTWLLEVQANALTTLLHDIPSGSTAVDVGGGHAQIAPVLKNLGFRTTILASNDGALEELSAQGLKAQFPIVTGDLLAAPIEDQRYSVVTCFRLLPHCTAWEALIEELCRIAAQTVIVDYPTLHSVNALAPLLFGAKKKVEQSTRPYTLFSARQIEAAFLKNGFHYRAHVGQFFWPMVVHRIVKQPLFSRAFEALPRALSLHHYVGSPVVARFDRVNAVP